jgi:ankyrin repeat protein
MSDAIAIHEAYKRGDLEALKTLLGNAPAFPNCRGPRGVGEIILEYAIYWSPLAFVRTLLELGADPNYQDHAGFPSLIAALSAKRPDRHDMIELLLSFGANIEERGVNDYTPLHYAASLDDPPAIALLLRHGANPAARTTIDDYETPLELAERYGKVQAAAALRTSPAR